MRMLYIVEVEKHVAMTKRTVFPISAVHCKVHGAKTIVSPSTNNYLLIIFFFRLGKLKELKCFSSMKRLGWVICNTAELLNYHVGNRRSSLQKGMQVNQFM
jgi:hypothetical protein